MTLTQLLAPVLTERAIDHLTDGLSGALDAILTVDLPLSPVPRIEFVIGSILSVYYLVAGTDAESSPGVIRPDDYATSTNEKVWKLISFGGSSVPTTRNINTTAPITGGGDLSSDRTIAIPASDNSTDGYLTSADHTTFAAKVGPTRAIGTTAPLAGGGDLSADRTLSIPKADSSTDGYLAAADFASFAAGGVPGSRAINTTAPLNGGGDLSADRTLSIPAADVTTDGYLASGDFATFDGHGALIGANTSDISSLFGLVALAAVKARLINTTAPLTGGGDLTADRTIAIPAADGSTNGYLTSANWTTFNNKVGTARTIGTTAPLTGGGDLSADRTIALPAATNSVDGYLTAADHTSFSAGGAGGVPNTRAISTTAPISGGGDLSADRTLSMHVADTSHDGYLSSTDWNTFNTAAGGGVPNTRAINTTAPITGGGNLTADRTLAMAASTDSVDGYMTASDHTLLTGKLSKSGGTMTGDLDMGGLRLITDKRTEKSTTLTFASTTTIDFDAEMVQTLTLTGNVTFATSNRAAGRLKRIKVLCDSSSRNVTFESGWIVVGTPGNPAAMLANATAYLILECFGTNATDVVARWILQTTLIGDMFKSDNLSGLSNNTTACTNIGALRSANSLSELVAVATTARTNIAAMGTQEAESGDLKRSSKGALQFDGTSAAKITGTSGIALGLLDFTISVIYEPVFISAANMTLFESHSSGSNRVRLQIKSDNQSILLLITNNSAVETTYTLTAATAFVVGTCYLITVTAARSGSAFGFVNGVAAGNSGISAQSAVNIGSGNATAWTAGISTFGQIHKVMVFRRVLTSAEVLILARKGIPDPTDQWGSFTALYTSDFSVGTDGFSSTAGLSALNGNVDSILSHDNVLQLITDTSNGNHYCTKTGVFSIGKRYRIDVVYYVPNSQTTNGFQIASGTISASNAAGTVNFGTTGSWQTSSGELTAAGTSLLIAGFSGTGSYTGVASQSVYIGSLIITQIGAGFDLDCENADPTNTTLVKDISGNGNDGTVAAGISQVKSIKQHNLGSLTVGGSAVLKKILTATAALDFGSILTTASADLTISVPGAAVGDSVSLGLPAAPTAGIDYMGFVSAADTVTVRATNATSLSIDPASQTFRATVFSF